MIIIYRLRFVENTLLINILVYLLFELSDKPQLMSENDDYKIITNIEK